MKNKTIGDVVKLLCDNKIKKGELASRMNISPDYLSMVITGKRNPSGFIDRAMKAIDEIIAFRSANK